MMMDHYPHMHTSSHAQSPSQLPASYVKHHHPYFSPNEVEYLSEKQRGKMSANNEKFRQQACGFIEAIGAKMGFPRKTIATAQCLYHRFHLYFPRKDFNFTDVSLACIYVSTKMHDTLKKPRDILMVSYAVRFPDLAARSRAMGGEVEMDPATVEQDRQRLLGVERLVLETICFNFTVRLPFPYVIKIGKALGASKQLTRSAWRLVVDSNRTLAPLQFPPHVIAIACLFLASLLDSFEKPPPDGGMDGHTSSHDLVKLLGDHGKWEETYQARVEDIEEICHILLDLLLHVAQNPSANTSPATPQSPSPHAYQSPRPQHPVSSNTGQFHGQQSAAPRLANTLKPDTLLRLKIHLREHEHTARVREDPGEDALMGIGDVDIAGMGGMEGTIRFKFGPERD